MVNRSLDAPQAAPLLIIEWGWYAGTDAVSEGEAFCYNTDYGTATTYTGQRANYLERPLTTGTAATSNNLAFAGVALRNYTAQTTGQFIEIAVPGSRGANVALGVDTVLGTGLLTFIAGASGSHRGRFYTGKYKGRGSAIPRQTVTAILYSDMDATDAWLLSTDGLTITGITATTNVTAGDTVMIFGGEDDATGAVQAGKYTVASKTTTTVVLTSTAVDTTAAGTLAVTAAIYTGNPTCQADLLTGEESGGLEFISLPTVGAVGLPYMVGGVSYICGGVTVGTADHDVTFAQGTLPDEKKAFILLGALATNNACIDLATAGITVAGGALAEVNEIDAAGDAAYFQFQGARWFCQDTSGGATEA